MKMHHRILFRNHCVLGQHRTIWQEHSAKDFASYESYKRAGILYVFPPFITARMGQKIGRRPQTQLCGDALGKVLRKTIALGLVCSLICGAALLRAAANDAPLLSDWAKEEALLAEQQELLPQERYTAL